MHLTSPLPRPNHVQLNFNTKMQNVKGGESSNQFQWFTIGKIELYFLF